MLNERDTNSPAYKQWRYSVYVRDHYTCCLCNIPNQPIEAHHIERWADNELLRYVTSNGVTLCKTCHELVTGREDEYKARFKTIVASKKTTRGYKRPYKRKWRLRNSDLRF